MTSAGDGRTELRLSTRAPNLWIADGVEIADGAWIGANVVIESPATIGDRAEVHHGAVLGRRPSLSARSWASAAEPRPLAIGAEAIVCAGAVVFAGARIGERAIVGDQSHVRERAAIGAGSVLGRGGALGPDAVVGERVRIQTMVWLTSGTIVEDDVFIGPGVMTMNDDQMGRCERAAPLDPPVFRRACRVGGGVLVTPGTEIGEEAFVASGAVLTANVPARARVRGVPARVYGTVNDDELIGLWQ